MSVIADAENRSKTWAYQTVSGDTTKTPLLIPGGLIMTSYTEQNDPFFWRWADSWNSNVSRWTIIRINSINSIINKASKTWFYLFCDKTVTTAYRSRTRVNCQQTPYTRTWQLGQQHNEQLLSNGVHSWYNYEIDKNIAFIYIIYIIAIINIIAQIMGIMCIS